MSEGTGSTVSRGADSDGRVTSRITMLRTVLYDPPAGRRTRAQSLAAFYFAGAALSSLGIVLPGWEGMHRGWITVTVAIAASGAALLWVFADRISRVVCHAFIVSGAVLIGVCQVFAGGGSATATYALLYVWVVLHAALFFSTPAVAAHLTVATLAHLFALLHHGDADVILPQLLFTMGTQVSAWLVVGGLATRLRRVAGTDPLTGVANRRAAQTALEAALADARRRRTPVCVALLDLDGFKEFNDAHGHPVGDTLLVRATRLWGAHLGPSETLARTGGDEFLVVMPRSEPVTAGRRIGELVKSTPQGVACSAGIVIWDFAESSDELLQRVDAALYRAKQADGQIEIEVDATA